MFQTLEVDSKTHQDWLGSIWMEKYLSESVVRLEIELFRGVILLPAFQIDFLCVDQSE